MNTLSQIQDGFQTPLLALLHQAHTCHQAHHPKGEIECAELLSIKTGACPEDCAYCPQSAHYNTGLKPQKLQPLSSVLQAALWAKARGATRFCMGAAWKSIPEKAMEDLMEMIKAVKSLGLETCMTLGMLTPDQAKNLKSAGLDFYNHNLDTSPEYYPQIIKTRTYQDRLDTLSHIASAGILVCCGGIVGMGESREDRIQWLYQLSQLPQLPKSLPINQLIPIPGTPLEHTPTLESFELIRTIAVARLTFPNTVLRLAAGRASLSPECQALCFLAGINSIFLGEKLLTAHNAQPADDQALLAILGLHKKQLS